MDAAAALFAESGYGNAALADVAARAGVSRGACSYHFPTKESLASALVAYSESELMKRLVSEASESASPLENLIRASFAQMNLIQHDPKIAVGIKLGQAQDQISGTPVPAIVSKWTTLFETALEAAVAAGDLKSDVAGRDVGYVLWCSIVANNMNATASGKHPIEGLALVWQVHLRGIVPAESARYFEQLVQRVAAQYAPKSPPVPPAGRGTVT